ncbi:MAG: hypothetical protein WDW36_006219 [Sanguina aurantia]
MALAGGTQTLDQVSSMVRAYAHYTARHASSFTAIATSALKELHAHKPLLYPPTPHEWYTTASNAPGSLVCCACFKPVIPGGQAQCCELCGVVAHFACCRGVPPDCKPWSLPQGRHGHDWRPTGTLADQSQDVSSTDLTAAPSLCLICKDTCEVGLFAVEPVWSCSGCKWLVHCQCYAHTHPDAFSPATLASLRCVSVAAATDPDVTTQEPTGTHKLTTPHQQQQQQQQAQKAEPPKPKQQQQALPQQQREGERPSSVAAKPAAVLPPTLHHAAAADAAVRATAAPRQPSPHMPRARGGRAFSREHAEGEPEMQDAVGAGNRGSIGGEGWVSAAGRRRKSSACAVDIAHLSGELDQASGGQQQQQRRFSLDRQHKSSPPPPSRPVPVLPRPHITSPCEVIDSSAAPSPISSPCHSHRKCLSLSCMSDALDSGWASPFPIPTAHLLPLQSQQQQQQQHTILPPTLRSATFHPANPLRSLSCSALAASNSLTDTQLAQLDECRDGLHACVILPAGAVRIRNAAAPAAHPTATNIHVQAAAAAAAAAAATAVPGQKPGSSGGDDKALGQQKGGSGAAPAAPAAGGVRRRGKHGGGLRKGAAAAAKRWWGSDRTLTKWQHFSIDGDALPLSCRPVLVFVNLKSGPQVGHGLRRQLLQLLHPLQVVELPRESPDEALMCWAGVPRLRLLVVGGDGTVGWVLSALERVAVRVAAAAAAQTSAAETGGGSPGGGGAVPWVQPPLAMLPLGTGNDLARCLNWGGGLGSVRSRGLDHCLLEVALAQQVQVDRWRVSIQPQVRAREGGGGVGGSAPHIQRSFWLGGGGAAPHLGASSGGAGGAAPHLGASSGAAGGPTPRAV